MTASDWEIKARLQRWLSVIRPGCNCGSPNASVIVKKGAGGAAYGAEVCACCDKYAARLEAWLPSEGILVAHGLHTAA